LRDALAQVMPQAEAAKALVIAFQQKPKMAKASLDVPSHGTDAAHGVVVDYVSATRAARARTRKGFGKRVMTSRSTRRSDVALAR
jgi:hypothetical protein